MDPFRLLANIQRVIKKEVFILGFIVLTHAYSSLFYIFIYHNINIIFPMNAKHKLISVNVNSRVSWIDLRATQSFLLNYQIPLMSDFSTSPFCPGENGILGPISLPLMTLIFFASRQTKRG